MPAFASYCVRLTCCPDPEKLPVPVSHRPVSVALAMGMILSTGMAALADPPSLPDVSVHLLDGGREDDARHLAGVEIQISAGWKTYWRHPGDSGLAPSFDFSDSVNVAGVEVLWPAPTLSHDGYGWVIGYERQVVFPLIVTAEDPDRAIDLVLALDFAVCAKICIPLDAAEARPLSDDGADRGVIAHYRDRVPVAIGERDDHGVVAVSETSTPDGDMLEFAVLMPHQDAAPQLIVEGPREWLFAVSAMARHEQDGTAVFHVPVAHVLPPDGGNGIALEVTGLSADFAFSQQVIAP